MSLRGLILAIIVMLGMAPVVGWAQSAGAPELKANFLLNFARFAEWPNIESEAPLVLCVFGDDVVLGALSMASRGQRVESHRVEVSRSSDGSSWKRCHLLFVGGSELYRAEAILQAVKASPVLTVSDTTRFAQTTGMIELFIEDGRMRFAINVDSVKRSGVHLSSRLLGLAKIVHAEDPAQ
jgi:hypothetical protein